MAQPTFSIGIDLGTSNSVLSYAPLEGESATDVLEVQQWDTPATIIESDTLPSFLYRPEEAVAAQLRGDTRLEADWVVGRLAQRKASETPGRVVKSAKSWLAHNGADRSAAFLPWGSDALGQSEKISPVAASAYILAHLRASWNARFAGQGAPFDAQDITITVPASFDAAAQRLTLDAAAQAGFPKSVRLLEEPQAAFYWWLAIQSYLGEDASELPSTAEAARHVLVIDVGGGTSDFSLFALTGAEGGGEPAIKRIAVSDHILLGGDNIDLAIAHLMEPRLASAGALSARQWDPLVARCRVLKEQVLGGDGPADEVFTVSIPSRGSRLFANSLSAQATRSELEALVLDGFFPDCRADDRPRRALGAIKEFGLPYAFDGAITRHLAAFLTGRPAVDAVLFNGGSLSSQRLRDRLREQIGRWRQGRVPQALDNPRPDLAVACGAAYSGWLIRKKARQIEAGAARAVFLQMRRTAADGGEPDALVCILPQGAAPSAEFALEGLDLSLRVNKRVRFQIFTSTRHEGTQAGDVAAPDPEAFLALPPLETMATLARPPRGEGPDTIPVAVVAEVNTLGLLQVSCRSLDPDINQSWPLAFNLRPHEGGATAPASPLVTGPNATPGALAAARRVIRDTFAQKRGEKEKLTAPRVFQSLETSLGCAKGDWNGLLLRELWSALAAVEAGRALSVEHEEVWLILAGFLLRPGFGAPEDEARIDDLWRLRGDGLRFPGKRTRLQDYILWRRVAGGLTGERQESLLAAERERINQSGNVAPELIRMVGAFERLSLDTKAELARRFVDAVVERATARRHCAHYLAALGLLLNRTPFHAGPESIVSPALVESAFAALSGFDWRDPELSEAQTLFLRAARAVDDRRLDLSRPLRDRIADRLQQCGVAQVKVERVRRFVAVERAERLSLYGEALPPGLILNA